MRTTIEMAREAGIRDCTCDGARGCLERLVELVRADEREQIAQMIEGAPPLVDFARNDQGGCMMCGFTPNLAANAIRARSNT